MRAVSAPWKTCASSGALSPKDLSSTATKSMSGSAFFDTNVFVYAIIQDDPRSDRAEELLAEGGTVSVQVLSEFATVARRKTKMPWVEIRRALDGIKVL